MGKDLNGTELGEGLRQENNGTYSARYRSRASKRIHRRFQDLNEARLWLADAAKFDNEKLPIEYATLTVNEWYEIWIELRAAILRPSTLKSNKAVFRNSILPLIGSMKMTEVRPLDCQRIFNRMIDLNRGKRTLRGLRSLLNLFFNSAVDNLVINESPLKRSVVSNAGKKPVTKEAMTLVEQKRFIDACEGRVFEYAWKFILQTGIRSGELLALTWDDVDFENRTLNIDKSLTYIKAADYHLGPPKSNAGYRKIPLTQEAVDILHRQKRYTEENVKNPEPKWANNIFVNSNGAPSSIPTYNSRLNVVCKKANIRHISMHILRHTFATRCIEAGMKPKTLQNILGHEDISVTMNMYVHITYEEKHKEINMISDYLKV